MYSDISILISAFSSSKSAEAKAFEASVFQTHVGHRNRKDQIGLLGSFNHALALRIAFETRWRASSCPTTLFFRIFSKSASFSISLATSFEAGIHVHLAMIVAISSASTTSLWISFSASLSSSSDSCFCFSGRVL
jgi:hypothetical protein